MAHETLVVDPEHASIEAFVEFCWDDDREYFDHEDLTLLAVALKLSPNKITPQLEEWGLRRKYREREKSPRGVHSSCDHDRWWGPGSEKTHGGSGQDQINGFAGPSPKGPNPVVAR
jgi:hypothetical protein